MANEASVTCSLQIKNGFLEYRGQPSSFRADVIGVKGPTPGAFTASTDGTDADLSELEEPGLCRIQNLDDANFVDFGMWDGVSFFPFGRVLPGETYVLRLSPFFGREEGVGTGTINTDVNTLRFKADTDPVVVLLEAFES